MNRSCNRENPHILIVMIAEKQIMKGGGDGKGREIMGPQKPAREMSDTAPEINLLPFFSLHVLFLLLCGSSLPSLSLIGMLDNIVSTGTVSCWVIAIQQMTRRVL
ncbi:hypothetical protein BDE02_06G201000 [Populus trichocarpa]|nr:hypothetical protein BDE02_06G201000 [Populus trichocarpa]